MLRALPIVLEMALLVFALIDCIQTDSIVVRNLSKGLWILLIILLPIVGSVAWLVAGRPVASARGTSRVPWPSTTTAGFPEYERPRAPRGPDDDPEFLSAMAASDGAHERMLRDWEVTLREREERLRSAEPPPTDAAGPEGDVQPR
ncbi:MAG: hypothetical protein HGA44_05245 [Cellulomonadaceae bacterium]|nr:hypothetical protein [Cellulomonadaceae bacterium]